MTAPADTRHSEYDGTYTQDWANLELNWETLPSRPLISRSGDAAIAAPLAAPKATLIGAAPSDCPAPVAKIISLEHYHIRDLPRKGLFGKSLIR